MSKDTLPLVAEGGSRDGGGPPVFTTFDDPFDPDNVNRQIALMEARLRSREKTDKITDRISEALGHSSFTGTIEFVPDPSQPN